MLELLLVAAILVAATVMIHAIGTGYWMRLLLRFYTDPDGYFKRHKALPAVIWTALILMMLHVVEVVLWAAAYRLLPDNNLDTFEKAAYFSMVTFTTLGYGDITLADHQWRLLSGIEALNGILLVGWTTAFLFLVVQRSWQKPGA
jgi:hypothetical protein